MSFEYTIWEDVGNQLYGNNAPKYLTPEKYKSNNPLENLVIPPDTPPFFGTRVLNLFVVCQPYGWDKHDGIWHENWPPDHLDESVERHIASFPAFTSYRTIMFMDFNLVNKVVEISKDAQFQDIMRNVKDHLKDLCESLADYGFELGPNIDGEVGPDFFQPYIDRHYDYVHQSD